MRTSAMCTTAPVIGMEHGGGASSYWELEALKATTDVKQIVRQHKLSVPRYESDPLVADYVTSLMVKQNVDVAIFNGGTWTVTMRTLQPDLAIVDCPAHNLKVSMEEFKRCGINYPWMEQYESPIWEVFSLYMQDADVVITQARQSIGYLEDLGIKPARFEVVPGGCILPDMIVPFPEQFSVGYLGAAGPDKGVSYLMVAWASCMFQDSLCVMAGRDLGAIPVEMPPFNRVKFEVHGKVDNVSDIYNKLSIYVQPSVTEGFGLPCLEAMAHGRPVIATQGAGVHEIIEDGVEGFVVPIRSAEAIADCIRYFHDNPSKVEEMGKAARKKAEQYPWTRAKEAYERIIQG